MCRIDSNRSTIRQPSVDSTRYFAEFLPVAREKLRLHAHPGVEFIYTLQGRLSVHVADQEHILETGDAMYFDSGTPHGYRRTKGPACSALVVTTS